MLKAIALGTALFSSALSFGQQGTWTQVTNPYPVSSPETALLLTDGSVLVKCYIEGLFSIYFKFTPDNNFSYQNGSWSQVASSINGVLFGPTHVLRDGRVLIAGGEYTDTGYGDNRAEIYNPVTNSWSLCPGSPYPAIGDTGSSILPDGSVICSDWNDGGTDIYNPLTNTWYTTGPMNQDTGDEESWQLLPDGSVLSVYFSGQRYIPSQHAWKYTAPLPTNMVDQFYEMGPVVILYNGKALAFGAGVGTGATAIYTPPSSLLANDDSWVLGPVIPNNYGCPDVAACVEANGKVLFVATPVWLGDASLFEYNPADNSIISVTLPDANWLSRSDTIRMLALPNGQVWVTSAGDNQVWLYTPTSAPDPSWQAHLTSYTRANDGSYQLFGTQLNGLTNGAAYGDEAEPNSGYPIVFLQNTTTGKFYFAHSFNHSTMQIATGSTPVSTHFTLPAGLPNGTYNLSTSASGVPSANSLTIGFGLSMPANTTVTATQGGTVSYNLPVADYFTPTRIVTPSLRGPSWVTWDGTTLTANPPSNVRTGTYPVTLMASDNGTPAASGVTSVLVKVAPVGLQTVKFLSPSVLAGNSVQLKITLTQPAPHGGTVVYLAPNAWLTCSSTVTIPEGASTINVTVNALSTSKPVQGQVGATLNGLTIPATVRVMPNNNT